MITFLDVQKMKVTKKDCKWKHPSSFSFPKGPLLLSPIHDLYATTDESNAEAFQRENPAFEKIRSFGGTRNFVDLRNRFVNFYRESVSFSLLKASAAIDQRVLKLFVRFFLAGKAQIRI